MTSRYHLASSALRIADLKNFTNFCAITIKQRLQNIQKHCDGQQLLNLESFKRNVTKDKQLDANIQMAFLYKAGYKEWSMCGIWITRCTFWNHSHYPLGHTAVLKRSTLDHNPARGSRSNDFVSRLMVKMSTIDFSSKSWKMQQLWHEGGIDRFS